MKNFHAGVDVRTHHVILAINADQQSRPFPPPTLFQCFFHLCSCDSDLTCVFATAAPSLSYLSRFNFYNLIPVPFSSREWTGGSSRTVQSSAGEAGAGGGHGIVLWHRAGVPAGAQPGPERQGPWVRDERRQGHSGLASTSSWPGSGTC